MKAQFVLLGFVWAQSSALAQFQGPTLAERVAIEGTDVAITISVDGPPSVFEQAIGATDLVVRGQIGKATGHLTEDGRDIYTTYEILKPQVHSPRPGDASQFDGVDADSFLAEVVRKRQGLMKQ
jgi:hypothetical protein